MNSFLQETIKNKSHNKGFTLIEILVAMVIMTFIIGSAYTMLNTGFFVVGKQTGDVDVRNDIRKAINLITKDIQQSAEVSVVTIQGEEYYQFTQVNNEEIVYYYDSDKEAIIRRVNENDLVFINSIDGSQLNPFTMQQNIVNVFDVQFWTRNKDGFVKSANPELNEFTAARRVGFSYTTPPPGDLSSEARIITYDFLQRVGTVDIRDQDNMVIIQVASGTNLTALIASFTLSDGATATVTGTIQVSGETVNNFSNSLTSPFIYSVIAENGTVREWRIVVTVAGDPEQGGDGIVLYVDSNGVLQPMPFKPKINTTDEDPSWTKLIITSGVGTQTGFNDYEYYAPEGITIESGVKLISDHSGQTSLKIVSDTGDIVIEAGVEFVSEGSSNNAREQIYFETKGNIDIRGVTMVAERYIYLLAGKNIFAQDAILMVTHNSQPNVDIFLELDSYVVGNKIFIENLEINFTNVSKSAKAKPYSALDGTLKSGSITAF